MNTREIFEGFERLKVLIVGDVMIDKYLVGKVSRISPEAPVPVVDLMKTDNRLGGAANVALNIKALGATPFLCSVIGNDEASEQFEDLLKNENLSSEGILKSDSRITTVKTRVLAKSQQLLRFDSEIKTALNETIARQFLNQLVHIINTKKIDVVLLQDYNKGVLTPFLIESVIKICRQKNIPTTVDPKKENFFAYRGVTLFKPNLKEITEAVDFTPDSDNLSTLKQAAKVVTNRLNNTYTLITLSEKGIFLDTENKNSIIIPTEPRNISDVCGAGDTVISVISLGLALGLDMEKVARMANLAGGIVCESVGVVPVNKQKLLREYRKIASSE
jgi:rfaE bifunctional protein kinase chain/domain